MLSSEDFFNTLMADKDSKKPILCHTSLYVVEHAQLQVKVQADSMTGKEICTSGRSGSAPYGFLTTKSLTEGFLHLHTQSMDLCPLQQVFDWYFVFCSLNTHGFL